jgi:dipeptidyl aminopeptidase/acylaminoacyl peptidase
MDREQYLDALLGLPRMAYPKASPDGRWVAWTWLGVGPAADVYVAPTDGSAPPTRMTNTEDNTLVVSWTPDSRAVLAVQDHHGDERHRLYRLDLDHPGVMTPLTEESPNYFLRGGQLHDNGRWLIYAANMDAATREELEVTWVYRHDLQTGERLPLARPFRGHYYVPYLNRPGTHIIYNRNDLHPAGEQVWLVDIEGKEDREILNFGADKKVYATWFPDGKRAVVTAEGETHTRLGVWDLDTGDVRWLLDDPSRNIEAAYVPYGSEQIVVIETRDAGVQASLMDSDTGEETGMPQVLGNLMPLAPVGDAGDWVAQYYSARQPVDLVRFSPGDRHPNGFTSLTGVWERAPLQPDDLTPAEDFRWRSVDGLEIQGWLYRAKGQARGTVVYVHGGPTSHSEDRVNSQIQFFVREGFNVLDPNYRGSTGFSLGYREAIKEDGWGGREQADIRAGIEALIEQGIAQRGKVGITGTSYGGYSSWYAITHWPTGLLAASAPVCGMTDLVVDYHTTRPDLRPYSEEMMGGNPAQVPERYYERSPINFVKDIKGKVLIVQGMQDPNVTPENVRTVEEALKREGIEFDLLAFADEGHGILRPKNQKRLYLRLTEFFGEAFSP